jgi:hypothetical protein
MTSVQTIMYRNCFYLVNLIMSYCRLNQQVIQVLDFIERIGITTTVPINYLPWRARNRHRYTLARLRYRSTDRPTDGPSLGPTFLVSVVGSETVSVRRKLEPNPGPSVGRSDGRSGVGSDFSSDGHNLEPCDGHKKSRTQCRTQTRTFVGQGLRLASVLVCTRANGFWP